MKLINKIVINMLILIVVIVPMSAWASCVPPSKTRTPAPINVPSPTLPPTATTVPTPAPIPGSLSTSPSTPAPVENPETAPVYLLELQRFDWGRGTRTQSATGFGQTVTSQSPVLVAHGSARNVGSEILTSVICVMKCWRGGTLVKSEEQVVGAKSGDVVVYSPIPPGDSFDFSVTTPDDPTVDNVTIEFRDSSGTNITVR
jgi:hypothetical protein